MELFKRLSQILIFPPVITFFYDLIKGWFVDAKFEIRPLKAWWKDIFGQQSLDSTRRVVSDVISSSTWNDIVDAPAPLVLLVLPVVFFLLYRIIFAIKGGKTGGYKSRY